MERAFAEHGLEWRYITLEVPPENLGDAVRGMRAMGFRGGNCTIPHKVAVMHYLDRISESAQLIGAVNCIVRQGDELVGENTDGKGFLQSLREVADPSGKQIVVVGAGGAARAISVELALAGASAITIVNRSRERGQQLVDLLSNRVGVPARLVVCNGEFQIPEETQVLINATPVGLFPDVDARLPLDFDTMHSQMIVADVVPNPPQTHLVKEARRRGCAALDGLGMLVNQGVIGFRLWTGIDPNPAVMHAALSEVFGQ